MNNDIKRMIEGQKELFYKTNMKKQIIKSTQKLQCAEFVTSQIGLQELIDNTFKVKKNTIYFDYLILKTYASETTLEAAYQYLIDIIIRIRQQYATFQIHINLKSLTISAIQRYYAIIVATIESNPDFTESMEKFVFYNIPSFFDTLIKMFKKQLGGLHSKIEYVDRDLSEKAIELLLA
jgi:hypothetical protein|tara:strand:- start:6 stop:542 length:537 start_codon:yes stop_codon:yes gene_type:complete